MTKRMVFQLGMESLEVSQGSEGIRLIVELS